jgi:flagellar biosynthetic protein FliR
MHLTAAELTAWMGTYFWPLVRVGAAVGAVPMLGARFVPMRVRLMLAIGLTLVITPVIPPAPAIDPLSLEAMLMTANQLIIGAAMGFTLALVFSAFVHGAQIIAMQMGLGFASLIDPQNGVEVPVVSQFYSILVTLIFLALDGHLALIELVAKSFHSLPLAAGGISRDGVWQLLSWASEMFASAVLISLPAVSALLLVNVAFGVMSRAAPQMHILAVGFPLMLLLGFVVILFTLPTLVPQVQGLVGDAFTLMRQLTGME